MEERASVSTHSASDTRTLHRFDKPTWKATSMIGSQLQVLLQSRFHPCRILPVLTSTESSSSILEPQSPWEALICCREFKKCTRRPVFDSLDIPCHHFVSPLRTDKRSCRRVFYLCRLPSRHLALSLCAEDVKAQYEALTSETRERLNNVLSQKKKVDPDTNDSLAHAHGYLKICRNPLLRVHRDVPCERWYST